MPLLTLAAMLTLQQTSYATEAARLTKAMMGTFYDSKAKIWKPKVESAESVGDQGYTFWPSLLAWQAIIEAAKVAPKTWKPQVGPNYDVLEQYYDRSAKAYCAWKFFPGNDDRFYDDNTWAVVACIEAYSVTHDKRYVSRATSIFDGFVKGGWDQKAGGIRWGTKAGIEDRNDHTVSATAAGALAALLVATTRQSTTAKKADQAWAKKALDWIRSLSLPNGLIQDGVKQDGRVMSTVWTYNTGVPIRAALEYARQTGDASYLRWAERLGCAAINSNLTPLYDGATPEPAKRTWYDGTYFVHYLVDGLRELSRATGDPRYLAESRREADFIRNHLRDTDGFYWRNMRLWQIDETRTADYARLTGRKIDLSPDASERITTKEALALPISKRPTTKTLLANAGTARLFWLLAH